MNASEEHLFEQRAGLLACRDDRWDPHCLVDPDALREKFTEPHFLSDVNGK
jgi:hypothetical protein